jgi:ribosomal protein S18 acetylase RimI-like enzyme
MIYRAATIRDALFISRVVTASWRDAYHDFLPLSFLESLDRNPHHDAKFWARRIGERGSVTTIISDCNTDVGVLRTVVGASSVPDADAQLTTLYLLSHARRRALGSGALALAWQQTSRRGARSLGVYVPAGNKAGQRFYEGWGAQRMGERVAFCLHGQPIMEIQYRFDARPLRAWDHNSTCDTPA